MSHSLIEIDGSHGEGGGQILRTSLTLALLTGKPFRLSRIRAGREKPGLQPQHLACVRAAASIGQARLRGASLQSSDLTFEPGGVTAGKYHFAIGTAGATSLVLHTVCLPLALRGAQASHVTITGGTHVSHSPAYHFLERTWRGYMQLLGIDAKLSMRHAGFYPRGGGVIEAAIEPCAKVRPLQLATLTAGRTITGFSAVAGLPEDIAKRQLRRARYRLQEAGFKVDLREETWPGGPGTVVGLELPTTPVPSLHCALGQRGKPAERVADDAVDQLLAHARAEPLGVDNHSGDQLVLPLALADGPSSYPVAEVTGHLLTNLDIIRRFVERGMICDGVEGGPGIVRVE